MTDLLPNTLGVPSRAASLTSVRSEQELQAICQDALARGVAVRVLGSGSNVLLPESVEGSVIQLIDRSVSELACDQHGFSRIRVGAGANWHDFVRRCIGAGLGGIENLALIPGTVGAAPIQNIGAYGVQLSDVLEEVRVYDLLDDRFVDVPAGACEFGYRDSIFKRHRHWIVCAVTLRLSNQPDSHVPNLGYGELAQFHDRHMASRPSPRSVMETVIAVRRRKLPSPAAVPNAGSFFKNPVLSEAAAGKLQAVAPAVPLYAEPSAKPAGVKVPAAWLIDQCGFKASAERIPTRVGVWHRQPLVLVNPARDTLDAVLAFADHIAEAVSQRFGVVLEREPELWQRQATAPE